MVRILHFSDAHIDMANYGRRDPASGLPLRVLDFLRSLDAIVDAAIEEKVDMVLFAGDAYKDRSPAPTFQREWGRRIMRLSHAGIPTLLLVGNHDLSPAAGRAHAVQEFDTLEVPHVHVISQPTFLGPEDLEGLPLQIMALPWISRSGLVASLGISPSDEREITDQTVERLHDLIQEWWRRADQTMPVVLTAHATVQGADFGSERKYTLGGDFHLPGALARDPRLSYTALGHVHKPQNLNEGSQPPVIYPGSIERVDFGEAKEDKFFVIAQVEKGQDTRVDWRRLKSVRPMIDKPLIKLKSPEDVTGQLIAQLPPQRRLEGAIVRLTVEYPREWEALIDEAALRSYAKDAFEFHLVKRPRAEVRLRLPQDRAISSLSPLELLEMYWSVIKVEPTEAVELQKLAEEVIQAGE